MERACWSIDDMTPIDVTKSFAKYKIDSTNIIIGNTFHTKFCKIKTCDLVQTVIGTSGQYEPLYDRAEFFQTTIILHNNIYYESNFQSPLICEIEIILKLLFYDYLKKYEMKN